MTEWQILNSDDFPEPPSEKPISWLKRFGWGLLAGGLAIILVVFAFMSLREKQTTNQTALREDLAGTIFEEQTLRYRGRPEAAVVDPEASPAWQQAYRTGFNAAENRVLPEEVTLEEIDYFNGECAIVKVNSPGQIHSSDALRAYCLGEQGWQRAPIPLAAWGDEERGFNFTNGVKLRFRSRDREFAETLAQDLGPFFKRVLQLPVWSIVAPDVADFNGLEIVIEPHDLQGALVSDEAQRIVLNSPILVAVSGEENKGLTSEAAVRLALAQALLSRTSPVRMEPSPTLPDADRWAAAVRTVLAMHMLLRPETKEQLLAAWQSQLDGQWASPFFADLHLLQPVGDIQARAAARLTANYIYSTRGIDSLPLMLQLLPDALSWDEVFGILMRRPTLAVEVEAARYTQHIPEKKIQPLVHDYRELNRFLPLMATVLRADALDHDERFFVGRENQVTPLLIELSPDTVFNTLDGLPLSAGCLTPNSTLELDGKWLELHRRLQASQVTVQDTRLLDIKPAPSDAVVFLVQGEPVDEQALTTPIYPNTRSYLKASQPPPSRIFSVLRSDGTLQPLLTLNPDMQLYPLPIVIGQSPGFLFELNLLNCEHSWFARYESDQGLTEQWFALPDEQFTDPTFCAEDDFLYRKEEAGQYSLMRLIPGRTPETLLVLDHPFQALICP